MAGFSEEKLNAALQKLTKWRVLLTGWQLGTRPKGDPEGDAVRDHREATILLRAEVSALVAALEAKFPGFHQTFREKLLTEAELADKDFEQRFPGVTSSEVGLEFDRRCEDWMKRWKP